MTVPDSQLLSDEELLWQWEITRNSYYFAEIEKRYELNLRRKALLHLKFDPDAAADVVQEAFMELIDRGRLGTLPKGDALGAWLVQVVRNLAITRFRKSGRQRTIPIGTAEGRPDPRNGPQEVSEQRERAEAVIDCLSSLSERDRDALVLTYYEGLSAREIAEILGKTEAAVRGVVDRARDKLANLLERRGIR